MADNASNNPCAIKIVDVRDGQLFLNVPTLRQVLLQEDLEKKKVCIISIAGAFRQGKSFLLNFFIRYLNVTSDERADLTKWLDPESDPIIGFSAKGGSDAVTTGIWIWSHIFLRKLSSGEEIAIILMDTQGAFDNKSSGKDSTAVFALSTLISSVQIYNLKDNINNLNWDCLEYFLNYAELVRQTVNQKPFQNLLFLIRDWPDEAEYLYGTFGGNQYLNKMINIGNRNQIYNLFNQINCFLLPDPGLEVRKYAYQGEVDKIEPKFKEYVEKLSSSILTSNNLTPKVLNGEPIKVRHLVDLFENYCKEFNKGDMPEGQTLFEANAKVQHMMAIEESETVYENQIKRLENQSGVIGEEMLLQIHESSKIIAVSNLNNKLLIGGDKMKRDSIAELSNFKQKPTIILLDCSKLQLGRGRLDDSVTAFRRRLEIFRQSSLPMLKAMDNIGRLTIVDGDTDTGPVQEDFKNVVKEHIEYITSQQHEQQQQQHHKTAPQLNGYANGAADTAVQDLEAEPIETISKHVGNGIAHTVANGVKNMANGFTSNGHIPNGYNVPQYTSVERPDNVRQMYSEVNYMDGHI